MRKIRNLGAAVIATSMLTACGVMGGGCSDVEVDVKRMDSGVAFSARITNKSDEAKLVEIGYFSQDGEQLHSEKLNVPAKDIKGILFGYEVGAYDVRVIGCD